MEIPKREYWRKTVHFSGIFFLPILEWNRSAFAALLAVFLAVYLVVEFLAKHNKRLPLFSTLTENAKREKERGHLSKGALFLVGSGLVLPFLLGAQSAAIGLSQTFTADVTSTLAGMKWGSRRLPWSSGKSWVGSLFFLATAVLATLPFVSISTAILLALVGTAVESLPLPELDNLTVPLAVAVMARFLH